MLFDQSSNKKGILPTMKKKLIVVLTFCSLIILSLTHAPKISEASELNFSVESVIPDNQRDKTKTYFDLRVAPNSEQVIELKLSNDTDKDVTVEPTVNTATTNSNGVVEYGSVKGDADKTLPLDLKDVITGEKEVVIPAKQVVTYPLTIKMPDTKFDGVLAGGITIQEKVVTSTEDSHTNSKGMAIKNKYAYVVAVLLNQTDNEVAPELELDDVKANQMNARNVINAKLHNIHAAYINSLTIDAEITRKGESEILYQGSNKNMQVAPNSNFNYPISLNGEPLKAGEYTLRLNATATEGKWSFTKNFTITAEDAKKYNNLDVSIKKDYTWIYILMGALLILLSIIIIILLISRNKQKKDEEKSRDKVEKSKQNKSE